MTQTAPVLSTEQKKALRDALAGRYLAVCFGSGVDSTAMLVALHEAGIRPHVILFANTNAEKPETLAHLEAMNTVLWTWRWPQIDVCRKVPLPSTPYTDLYGLCIANETLPSLAFGPKTCSIGWKQSPQDQLLKGVKSGPNAKPPHPLWIEAQQVGQRFVKLIGYDCGKADIRRSKSMHDPDDEFDFAFPLQILEWDRFACIEAITKKLGAAFVPIKSACFFCPASRPWELFWLASHHPDMLEAALEMERRALIGKHSRLDTLDFGAAWEKEIRTAGKSFPSLKTTVGLGRRFAWNHWALVNDVVDSAYRVRRAPAARERFASMAEMLHKEDNALDARSRPTSGKPSLAKGKNVAPKALAFS